MRRVSFAPLAAILVYAAALRVESLTAQFGVSPSPAWLHAIQQRAAPLVAGVHPAAVRWDPGPMYPHRDGPDTRYSSDPYTYLRFARAMPSFYAAHVRRDPRAQLAGALTRKSSLPPAGCCYN